MSYDSLGNILRGESKEKRDNHCKYKRKLRTTILMKNKYKSACLIK